jgi:hypothetical protein
MPALPEGFKVVLAGQTPSLAPTSSSPQSQWRCPIAAAAGRQRRRAGGARARKAEGGK